MKYNYAFIHFLLLQLLSYSNAIAYHLSSDDNFKWLSPFDNRSKLAALCTQNNRQLVMHRSGITLLYRLFQHDALCSPEIERYVPSRHISLVWFMQALQYCEVNHVLNWKRPEIHYNRTFQVLITRAAFALVCQEINDINLYGLMKYADLFRILFEDNNTDRRIICQQIQNTNNDLFQRCLADKPNNKLYLLNKMCSGNSTLRLIKMNVLFQRFARNCHTLHDFVINMLPKYSSFGEALSNDIYFMNLLSNYLISTINRASPLLEIVLKTRLHLQLFSITAVKLQRELDKANIFKTKEMCGMMKLGVFNNEKRNNIFWKAVLIIAVEMVLFMIITRMIMINSIIVHMKEICLSVHRQMQKLGF